MDELEDTAKAYCTGYSRTNGDWVTRMVKILMSSTPMPMYQKDRLKLYDESGIPPTVARDMDGRALTEALNLMHKGLTTNEKAPGK